MIDSNAVKNIASLAIIVTQMIQSQDSVCINSLHEESDEIPRDPEPFQG
jgi:hypothetical protein